MKVKITKGFRALSFTAILAAALFGGFTCVPPQEKNNDPKPVPVVQEATTNQAERANEKPTNLKWFIDSSNYIWDGWKIK